MEITIKYQKEYIYHTFEVVNQNKLTFIEGIMTCAEMDVKASFIEK